MQVVVSTTCSDVGCDRDWRLGRFVREVLVSDPYSRVVTSSQMWSRKGPLPVREAREP